MNPTQTQARRMVLVSVFVLAVLAVFRSRKGGGQPDASTLYRRLWAVGAVGLGLSLSADFVPRIAGPFAVLAVLGSLSRDGDQVLQNMLGTVTGGGQGRGDFAPGGGQFGGGEFPPTAPVRPNVNRAEGTTIS